MQLMDKRLIRRQVPKITKMYNTFAYNTVQYNSLAMAIARLILTRPIFLGQMSSTAELGMNANEPIVLGDSNSVITL